ncbi:inter-alpha-trypsin inhibitor heavy chain H5 [Stigmatopora argus]
MKGPLALLLFCAARCALGQVDYYFQPDHNDTDLVDLDLDLAPRRLPRQVKSTLIKETRPHVQELSVNSSVVSRYALTTVRCVMVNRHAAASKGVFHFPVPPGALVSNFTMIIAGRVYQSQVRPKERRKKVKRPDGDKESSRASSSKWEVDVFRVAVSIPGGNRAVFLLTYEELLRRRLGRYEHVIALRPLQLVSRLRVRVTLADRSPIASLEVPPLRPARPPVAAAVVKREKNAGEVTFAPSVVQQARMATDGVLGDLVVRYDVQRPSGVGDVQVQNGHFVHFFAPEDLPPVPKRVVFVIDTSASMLGTKMRQTKEALLAIVRELRAIDRFNFVSFSNKIKVWRPQRLVAVTPLNVRDAKKFIFTMMPTGGTDMDGALRAASSLLRADRTAPLADAGRAAGGASLVLLLTDGRPAAAGESRSAAVSAGEFCVFAVGIGDDADHQFLRRVSMENCGAARRVRREADTGAALRGLYREMSTPLLSNIRMDYDGSAEHVTPHLFADYFNGSELAVAGKLSDGAGAPRVGVVADGRDGTLVLGTPAGEPESRTPSSEATGDFAERAWAFLALKEALRSRWRSATAAEREEHVRRATHLALAYGFLTPLTDMPLDRAEVSAGAADREDGPWPDRPHGQSLTLADVGGQVEAVPSKKSITFSRTSADGDPHFVVDFPLSKTAACFDINGEPGHVLRLVSDHKFSGVTVNGKLVGAPPPPGGRKRRRTYFSSIAVVADRPARAYVEVTPAKVILDGSERRVLPCHSAATAAAGPLSVSVAPGSNVTVSVGAHVSFVVLLHRYKNPAPYQRDHLGFYIQDGQGLSSNCHGLLGQFLHEEAGVTLRDPAGGDPPSALLKVRGRSVPVVRKRRRIYGGSRSVDCWFARNNGARLVDGRYEDYVAPHMFDTGDGPHGSNTA